MLVRLFRALVLALSIENHAIDHDHEKEVHVAEHRLETCGAAAA